MEASYMIRLDRFLANMGIGTRKEVKKLISSGAVNINGKPVKDSGIQIDENNDSVTVMGEVVEYKPFVYLMMNKPAGVLSASEDARGAITAADLVAEEYGHYGVSPAGRLDKDSEGFLILTNDGDYIHNVISLTEWNVKLHIMTLRLMPCAYLHQRYVWKTAVIIYVNQSYSHNQYSGKFQSKSPSVYMASRYIKLKCKYPRISAPANRVIERTISYFFPLMVLYPRCS